MTAEQATATHNYLGQFDNADLVAIFAGQLNARAAGSDDTNLRTIRDVVNNYAGRIAPAEPETDLEPGLAICDEIIRHHNEQRKE